MSSSLRPLVIPIYTPALLAQLSDTLTSASIALFALEVSGSRAVAGLAVGAAGIGQTMANLPASLIYNRLGARLTLATGQVLNGAASLLAALACRTRSLRLFTAALTLIGVGEAIFTIGRSSRVREITAPAIRGRANSLFGGITRISQVVGPPIGGAVVARAGVSAAFTLRAVGLFAATAVVLCSGGFAQGPEPPSTPASPAAKEKQGRVASSGAGSSSFARCVVGCVPMFTLSCMRKARDAVIPLIGQQVGLGPQQLGVLVGFSSMAETLLFLPAGWGCESGHPRPASLCGAVLTPAVPYRRYPRTQGNGYSRHDCDGPRFCRAWAGGHPARADAGRYCYRRRERHDGRARAGPRAGPGATAARHGPVHRALVHAVVPGHAGGAARRRLRRAAGGCVSSCSADLCSGCLGRRLDDVLRSRDAGSTEEIDSPVAYSKIHWHHTLRVTPMLPARRTAHTCRPRPHGRRREAVLARKSQSRLLGTKCRSRASLFSEGGKLDIANDESPFSTLSPASRGFLETENETRR